MEQLNDVQTLSRTRRLQISQQQLRHLDFIGQFTTDIQHVSGSNNCVADAFSCIEEISTQFSINYAKMAKAQEADEELQELRRHSSLKIKSIVIIPESSPLFCDVSTGQMHPCHAVLGSWFLS